MQIIKNFIVASIGLVALSLAGCEVAEKVDPSNPPTMQLDRDNISVTGEGGDMAIFYSVTNPIKGEMPEVKANVEWITPG